MTLAKDSPFDIRLSSGREARSYGIILERGSLQVQAIAQDDSVYVRNVGKRPGDFDEQRSWKGGRGHEKFSDNSEGFWDGTAWTMTKGHVHNGLLWRFATGLRKATSNFSLSKSWRKLVGVSRGISVSFTPEENGTYRNIAVWARWRGSSVATNALTLKIHSDTAGSPGAVLETPTAKAVSSVNGDTVSALLVYAITQTLTAGTTYHITISGASTSNEASHWEVAVDAAGTSSKISSDLSTWAAPASTFSMLYRITDANINKRFYPFFLDGHLYVVDRKDNKTTASQVYINGDRGKATAGGTATLTDTNNGVRSTAWTTDMWAAARIRIVRGTGVGQKRTIASNTGTVITVTEDWDLAPSTDSEYVIYSTLVFQELTTTGLGVVTGEPAVMNNIVYFPQGTGTAIRDMALDYTVATNHKYRSEARAGSEYANFLLTSSNKTGTQMWRVLNTTGTVSFAPLVAYATDLTFGTAIPTGDLSYPITGINEKDTLQVFKENGPGMVSGNAYVALKSGQEDSPDDSNGAASVVVDKFLYYSWLHSLVRVYGASYDDIGQDFSGLGLPANREGYYAYLDAYITTVLGAIDAGRSGISSVLMWDGLAFHELFRHPLAGFRVRMVKVQPNPEGRNIIWFDFAGGDLAMVAMPLQKKDPLLDSGALYQHESVVESAIIDMGAASDLPKMIKSLTATVKNLNSEGMECYLDYQVDENCHTTAWTSASIMTQSPEATVWLGLQNIRRFCYRLRLNTDSASVPVDVEGVVPTGYARTPLKLMWTMRIKAGGIYQAGSQTTANSQKLWKWLMDNARFPYAVYMESKYEAADGYHCVVHPPRMTPYKPSEPGQPEESYMTLTLEEI